MRMLLSDTTHLRLHTLLRHGRVVVVVAVEHEDHEAAARQGLAVPLPLKLLEQPRHERGEVAHLARYYLRVGLVDLALRTRQTGWAECGRQTWGVGLEPRA